MDSSQKTTAKNVALKFIQVGVSKLGDRLYRYSDLPTTMDKWVIHRKYRPANFDLVLLSIEGVPKCLSGWWDGTAWTGLRVKPEHKVKAWKKHEDYV